MKQELEQVFKSVLSSWDSELVEFNCEADHAHLIVSYPPQKLLSSLIANLKATSSKTMWRKFESTVSKVYFKKKVFWTGSYFVSSCGEVTIDVLRKYVQQQQSPSL
jgi:putative transposase